MRGGQGPKALPPSKRQKFGESTFAFCGQLPQIILTGLLSRSHVQLGISHVILDVLGPGESNCELPDSNILECAAKGVIVDGPYGSSRDIIAPIFSMKEDPISGGVL